MKVNGVSMATSSIHTESSQLVFAVYRCWQRGVTTTEGRVFCPCASVLLFAGWRRAICFNLAAFQMVVVVISFTHRNI